MKLCYHCMSKIESSNKETCPHCNKKLDDKRKGDRFLLPGSVLQGRFIVGHPIGYGGFGNTYIGWDEVLYRKVAIKECFPEQFCYRASDGIMVANNGGKNEVRFHRALRNFLEEARSVASLQDIIGVVKISDFFQANGTGYIVMEYLEGMDVKAILNSSDSKKDYEWSRRVILTVLHTLREIHARGVLHRDIAPDNIFVTNDGVIKLIDFGAAKHSSELVAGTQGEIILKKGYSPIEQYGTQIPQGIYTDLYGVAALFYRMLTGQKPIPADMRVAGNDGLLAPSDMGIKIPYQAECAMMICLSIHPEYRLQSADEFMEALEGKNFIPVYEPEWILPKVEDNSTWKNRLKSLPLSAKISLGLIMVLIIAGAGLGGYAIKASRDATVVSVDTANIQDLSGKTMEDAEKYVAELNRRYHLNLEIEGDTYVYNASEDLNNTIKDQSLAVGTDLQDPDIVNPDSDNGLYYNEDGILSGTIYCSINSAEKISYGELKGKNVFEISKLLEKDITDPLFKKEYGERDEKHPYWSLMDITMNDGTQILPKQINKKKNSAETINISDVQSISYYAYTFFMWDELPDFAKKYETFEQLNKAKFLTYDFVDETHKESSAKKKLKDDYLDKSYYSLSSSYPEGKIIGQTVEAGKPYDGSVDTGLQIKIIKKNISIAGLTAGQARDAIREATKDAKDIQIYVANEDNSIDSFSVHNEKGEDVSYFKDNVTINITGQKPVEPEPVHETNNSNKGSKPKSNPKTKSKSKKKNGDGGSGIHWNTGTY